LAWVVRERTAGRLPSLLSAAFDFEDLPRAHSLMEANRAFGKFVVRV
ncbi:zinc-binding dehydrogenase, partial [Pseudomonas aeruginosa]|nr:zinc-binding dehydrogenase [Pseudomonas aeruginosa]